MPSSRCLFRLVPSEPPTDETGCSSSQGEKIVSKVKPDMKNVPRAGDLLPTPRAMEIAEDPDKFVERNGDRQNSMPNLASMAKFDMLPTPRANVVNGCDLNNPKLAERHKSNLEEEVAKMVVDGLLPTPLAGEYRDAAITENNATMGITDNISRIVSRVALGINKDGSQMDGVSPSVVEDDGPTSRLSPLFTEEMMGFPLMWTALPFLSESGAPKPSKPTATPSSPK